MHPHVSRALARESVLLTSVSCRHLEQRAVDLVEAGWVEGVMAVLEAMPGTLPVANSNSSTRVKRVTPLTLEKQLMTQRYAETDSDEHSEKMCPSHHFPLEETARENVH